MGMFCYIDLIEFVSGLICVCVVLLVGGLIVVYYDEVLDGLQYWFCLIIDVVFVSGDLLCFVSFLLFLYCNCICDVKFEFDGCMIDLFGLDDVYCYVLYGYGWLCLWQVEWCDEMQVDLCFEYCFDISCVGDWLFYYEVCQLIWFDGFVLLIMLFVCNFGVQLMLFGMGYYLYYLCMLYIVVKVYVDVMWYVDVDVLFIYVGDYLVVVVLCGGMLVDVFEFDNNFVGWLCEVVVIWLECGWQLVLQVEQLFDQFVVYVLLGVDVLCVEFVMNMMDSFNVMEFVLFVGGCVLVLGELLQVMLWWMLGFV